MDTNKSQALSDDHVEKITKELENNMKFNNNPNEEAEEQDKEGEDEEDDEFEFFVYGEMSSPVSAEDVFHNGQIRPLLPFSDDIQTNETTSYDPPVRKVYVVSSSESENDVMLSSEKLPEMSRKSNSTGFSKLRRVRDLLIRSNSDGKDAFVFLTEKNDEKIGHKKEKNKGVNISSIKSSQDNNNSIGSSNNLLSGEKKGKEKEKQSPYEMLYGKREKKGGKSYLPYKQELVGFFTSANGMSRNVHPY